jgi:phage protein D
MEVEELAERYNNFYAPNYQILIAGKDIFRKHLIEITNVSCEDRLGGADSFSFSINDPGVKCLDSDLFEPGKIVEIKMGYGDQLATMIVGEITSLRPNFPTDGTPQLEISGYDLSHQFGRVNMLDPFEDMTDSEIVEKIVDKAKHKLEKQIETTKTKRHLVVQDEDKTVYKFIEDLAARNFFEFFVKERTLYFREPIVDESEIVPLKYGESLLSFNPELNTANQVSEVTVRGWNPKTKEEIVGRAQRGREEGRERGRGSEEGRRRERRSGGDIVEDLYGRVEARILDTPVFTQEEADTRARSILNRMSEGLIQGSANCIGIPEIRAGVNIKLEGLGNKFSRKYYIARTTHTLSNSGYSTTFNIKENTI